MSKYPPGAWEGLRTSRSLLVEHISAPDPYAEGNCAPTSVWERYDLADPVRASWFELTLDGHRRPR